MEGRQPASLAVRLAGFRQAARCLREAASQDAGVGEGPDPRQRFRTWLQREGRRVQGGNPERCRRVLEQDQPQQRKRKEIKKDVRRERRDKKCVRTFSASGVPPPPPVRSGSRALRTAVPPLSKSPQVHFEPEKIEFSIESSVGNYFLHRLLLWILLPVLS